MMLQLDPPTLLAMEWAGCILGLSGSFLLATHTSVSPLGWYAYLGANIATGLFAAGTGANGLLIQQLGFTASTLLGIYKVRRRAAIQP